ncbi:MAG: Uma2 family endonuclease [Candidatus Electrothrix aestuarii]|uniref:Uma2 family endonuclease n=1 Tax=Candidatus Electrothrix aestuarii TaxID=3062594 RepID=A0AAU8LRY9_9BACT|nr:Uma2 family endonuclease [Candidatus Electrothrix aestuarii]
MNWQEVCEHPRLKNLPFKIELNEDGKIIMTPVKVFHSAFQGELEFLLRSLLQTGKTLPECAIATGKGTKVADVVWASDAVFSFIKNEIECSVCPEICVEVFSSSNTHKEMEEKRQLYFDQGAREFWLCTEQGDMSFFDSQGELDKSRIVPDFPTHIDL